MATLTIKTSSDSKQNYLMNEHRSKTFWSISSSSVSMKLTISHPFSNYQDVITVYYSYAGNSGSQTVRFSPHETSKTITVGLTGHSIYGDSYARASISGADSGSITSQTNTYSINFTTTYISAGRIIYASDVNDLVKLHTAGNVNGLVSKDSSITPFVIPSRSRMGTKDTIISATDYNQFLTGTFTA